MTPVRTSTDKCASCDQFPINEAVKARGMGLCAIRREVHRWDNCCVLHNRASDWRNRRDAVLALTQTQQENNDAR